MSSAHIEPQEPKGISRRGVIKAAAWSAPVIAVAVATPLASASPSQANVVSGSNSTIDGDFATGEVSGLGSGYVGLSNVVGTWETGELTGELRLLGPFTAAPELTWTNGNVAGTPVTVGTHVITVNGVVWTTVVSAVTSGVNNGFLVTATGPSQTAESVFTLPSFSFEGTANPDTIAAGGLVTLRVRARAANVGNGGWAASTTSTWPDPE